MGVGTTFTPVDIFKAKQDSAMGIRQNPFHYPGQKTLFDILSRPIHENSDNALQMVEGMIQERAAAGNTKGMEWASHKEWHDFKHECETAFGEIQGHRRTGVDITLPVGMVEAGLLQTANMVSYQELKMIRAFLQLSQNDLVYLLEHPDAIEDMARGAMPYEAEGPQAEEEELAAVRAVIDKYQHTRPSDLAVQHIMRLWVENEGSGSRDCNDAEKRGFAHPTDTVIYESQAYLHQHEPRTHSEDESQG